MIEWPSANFHSSTCGLMVIRVVSALRSQPGSPAPWNWRGGQASGVRTPDHQGLAPRPRTLPAGQRDHVASQSGSEHPAGFRSALPTRAFELGSEFVTSLAVAGTQGTIGFRMKDTVAERRLRAKTGTLRGVSALSGYVEDPAGDTIAFAILVQGYRGPVSPIWDVQNDIGLALASAGETWTPEAVSTEEGVEAVMREPDSETSKGGAP